MASGAWQRLAVPLRRLHPAVGLAAASFAANYLSSPPSLCDATSEARELQIQRRGTFRRPIPESKPAANGGWWKRLFGRRVFVVEHYAAAEAPDDERNDDLAWCEYRHHTTAPRSERCMRMVSRREVCEIATLINMVVDLDGFDEARRRVSPSPVQCRWAHARGGELSHQRTTPRLPTSHDMRR